MGNLTSEDVATEAATRPSSLGGLVTATRLKGELRGTPLGIDVAKRGRSFLDSECNGLTIRDEPAPRFSTGDEVISLDGDGTSVASCCNGEVLDSKPKSGSCPRCVASICASERKSASFNYIIRRRWKKSVRQNITCNPQVAVTLRRPSSTVGNWASC